MASLNYVAGFLAHHGSIMWKRNYYGNRPQTGPYGQAHPLIVVNCRDSYIVKGLEKLFGGSIMEWRAPRGVSLMYRWQVVNRDAEAVARQILPYMLNPIRSQELQRIVEFYREIP